MTRTGFRSPKNILIAGSFAFLLTPWIIFIFGWLKWWGALLAGLPLLWALAAQARSLATSADSSDSPLTDKKVLFTIAMASLFWSVLSGAGGIGLQNSDWFKHNAILKEIVTHAWPVLFYMPSGDPAALVYYVAYYLPAGLMGRILGWKMANWTLFATSFAGFYLAASWFVHLARRRPGWALAAFGMFGGLDIVGSLLVYGRIPMGFDHIEWWAYLWEYPSHSTQFFWAPQHALPGWIATALVLNALTDKQGSSTLGLLLASLALWSPFVAVGLAPFVVAVFWINDKRSVLSEANLVAAPLLLILGYVYFSSHNQNVPHNLILNAVDGPRLWPQYALFALLEFGMFFWFLKDWSLGLPGSRVWAWLALGTLAALPFYRVGFYNDLAMRACNPSLFILCLLVVRNLVGEDGRIKSTMLLILAVAGAMTGLFEISRSLSFRNSRVPEAKSTLSFRESDILMDSNQYNGDISGAFFRVLAKNRKLVNLEAE